MWIRENWKWIECEFAKKGDFEVHSWKNKKFEVDSRNRFTFFIANSQYRQILLNSFSCCEFTLSSLSILQIHFEFTSFFANSIRIQYFFREFTLIHYFFANKLSIYYLYREFSWNKLFFSQIHIQFTIYFANSLRMNYLYREFSLDSLSSLRIHL